MVILEDAKFYTDKFVEKKVKSYQLARLLIPIAHDYFDRLVSPETVTYGTPSTQQSSGGDEHSAIRNKVDEDSIRVTGVSEITDLIRISSTNEEGDEKMTSADYTENQNIIQIERAGSDLKDTISSFTQVYKAFEKMSF